MHQPAPPTASNADNLKIGGPSLGMSIPSSTSAPAFVQKNFQIGNAGSMFSVLTPPAQQQATDKKGRCAANKSQNKGRRKCRWKLKFHHQALPPEYREHYEASEGAPHPSTLNPPESSRVKSESSTKSAKQSTPSPKSSKSTASSGRSSVIMPTHEPSERPIQELPYMGEITLDSKPRRGRKPKKADICHLIYKNYGTIFPPPKIEEAVILAPPQTKPSKLIWAKDPQQLMAPQKNSAMGQWPSPSSLLERRLTSSEADAKFGHQFVMPGNFPAKNCDFSLNRTKSSSSSSVRTSSDCDEMHDPSMMRSPQLAQACVERLLSYAAAGFNPQKGCVQAEPLNLCTRDKKPNDGLLLMSSSSDSEDDDGRGLPKGPSDGFVFWPNPSVFVNPQLLYKTPPPSAAASQPPPSLLPPPPPPQKLLTAAAAAGKKKRKRSAIFIPPAESPTEVSICKFKFTGGLKPTLEEKKMLSVDAGGNFRFYSGTDKGMRSFLPHLQQHQSNPPVIPAAGHSSPSTSVSPTQGVKNLNISDRARHPAAMPSASSAPHHLARLHPPSGPNPLSFMPQGHDDLLTKRKRRSRKSEVREKLEKTFKEKGFLIQTQQLESAEGATYCKFRQLRKFTRYLFRSWRDYLPENVQQLPAGQQQQQHQMRMHDYEQSNSGSQETVILPHSP